MSAALRALRLLPATALLAAAWQAPQSQPAAPPLRITVTLVQVDAVVTDSSGRHVPGLTRDDFQILQDGQPRPLTWFAYVPEPPPAAKPSVPVPVPLGPSPIAPGQVQRTVALVVDDVALSFENLVRTRDALRKFIEKDMQPGDLVALVRTGGGVAILEQFTTDKRILLEAVSLLRWKFYGRIGSGVINPVESGAGGGDGDRQDAPQAAPEALDYDFSMTALGALRTLEEAIQGMKRFPGRKSIVFLSDSLRVTPELSGALDHLTDLANRSAVSLYTVDPGGLRTGARMPADDIQVYSGGETERRFPSLGGADPADNDPPAGSGWQSGLSYLAARTGGLFYGNANDIPGAIRAAASDQLGYYLLGYSPGEGTFERNPRNARFHKVTVKVNRPGLKVRWKSGFEGVSDEALRVETASTNQPRERQLAEALLSPFAATGLKVRLTSLFMDTKAGGPVVHSLLHIDAKDMTLKPTPDGAWNGTVDMVAVAYRGLHQNIVQVQRVVPIHLSDAAYRRAMKEGFLLHMNAPVKEPGSFLIRAVVRDWDSRRIGSASQVITVPDVRKKQFAMSGVTVRLAPKEVLETLDKAQIANTQAGAVEEWSEGGPATRRFRPGQIVAYGFTILNPKLDKASKQPRVTAQTHLFRDGKLVFTGGEFHQVVPQEGDPTRFVSGCLLRFGASLVPGEYLLQVTVTDGLAPKKKGRVSEWMDFEVVNTASTAAREAPASSPDSGPT